MGCPKNNLSLSGGQKDFWALLLVSTALALSYPTAANGQTEGAKTAEGLRDNTVRVQGAQNGFGFIVGERSGSLYIVTARHLLVTEDDPDTPPVRQVQIVFYGDQGAKHTADVLGTHDGDLAVLRTAKPAAINWIKQAQAPLAEQSHGTSVWFVGKHGEWYVPGNPGAIASDRPSSRSEIEIDGLAVSKGTSGAPLVSKDGIIGMILADDANDTRALTLDSIQRDFAQWNYPWDLSMSEATPAPSPGPKTCSVSVRSTPAGANVSLDGAARGATPTTLELTSGQKYELNIEKERYAAFTQTIDCGTRTVSATLEKTVGTVTVSYAGDQYGCSLQLQMKIGDKTFTPTSNSVVVDNVPLGQQPYSIKGQIGCVTIGACKASGAGTLQVDDGASFNVIWRNTGFAACTVQLQ